MCLCEREVMDIHDWTMYGSCDDKTDFHACLNYHKAPWNNATLTHTVDHREIKKNAFTKRICKKYVSLLDFVSIRVKTLYYSAKLVFQVIHPKSTRFSLFWNMVLEADLCLHCDTEAVTPREKNDCRIRKIEDWRTILVASHNSLLCWYTIWGGGAPSNISNMSSIGLSVIKALTWLAHGSSTDMRDINSPLIFPGSN